MEEIEKIVEEYHDAISITRNSTKRSRYAEKIVTYFLKNQASAAQVHWERSEFDLDTLYQGLVNVCRKEPYVNTVRVQKRDGKLILLRIK